MLVTPIKSNNRHIGKVKNKGNNNCLTETSVAEGVTLLSLGKGDNAE